MKDNNFINNEFETKTNFNDNSFNQLLNLQLLIQKHSGLKELCKYNNHFILVLKL